MEALGELYITNISFSKHNYVIEIFCKEIYRGYTFCVIPKL